MTDSVPRNPQLARIAKVLGVEIADLQGLGAVPDADLHTLHDQMSVTVHGDDAHRFAGIAALSSSLPGATAAKIAEKFLPPVLAARVAELLEPERVRDLVSRISVPYLADIALALDPVGSRDVLRAIPPERIAEVTVELCARQEYVGMVELMDALTIEGLTAALLAPGSHHLEAIAPLVERSADLEQVVAQFPEELAALSDEPR